MSKGNVFCDEHEQSAPPEVTKTDLCKESKSPKTSLKKAISGLCKIHQKYHQRHLLQEDANKTKQERKTEKSAKVEKIMLFSHVLRKKKRSSIDQNDSVCHYLSHSTSEESENNSLPLSDYTCGRFVQFLSDGTRVVEVTKPPHKPYGFFTARRKVGNSRGTFVTRMRDCESSIFLSGLLDTRIYLGKLEDGLEGKLFACVFGCCDTVVIVVTDRICKVWDWRTGCILSQMALDGGSLSYVVGDEEGQHFISGSTNGILNVYQYDKEFASFKHGLVLDLWKLTREHQRKKLSFMCGGKPLCSIKPQERGEVIEGHVEAGGCGGESTNCVLALHWIIKQQSEMLNGCQSQINYLERDDYLVAVATNTSLLVVDLKSHELLGFFDLREQLPVSDPSCASWTVGLIKTAALSVERKENITVCAILVPLLGEELWVVKMDLQLGHQEYLNNMFSSLELKDSEAVNEEELSFLSCKPPGSSSLLRLELKIKCSRKSQKRRFVSCKNSVLSHPVTFHSKVKSSGYTSTQVLFSNHVLRKPASDVSAHKMKRKSICLDVKLQVLRQLEASVHQADMGASLNLAKSMIRTIIKNADKIKSSGNTTSIVSNKAELHEHSVEEAIAKSMQQLGRSRKGISHPNTVDLASEVELEGINENDVKKLLQTHGESLSNDKL
ncbi:uncharacterized protein LOC143223961 [Tachypleus tridentatus]|uniref:uncharacterized protein LOC143223961 n=1 Tax=Tachypleus tridentatus TaxID=6853 RepID=UPI003FCF2095